MDNRTIWKQVVIPLMGFAAIIFLLYLVAGSVGGSR